MDTISKERRSANMRAIRAQDTKPEMRLRRLIHGMGFRYRLHRRNLPGTPDLVFSARRKVIFVHGCFWHGHSCRRGFRVPRSNTAYWGDKLERNRRRDLANQESLEQLGWTTLVIWECELSDLGALSIRARSFLGPPSRRDLQH
jgi:DNA mismatch endonuclease, patch repair protein